MTTAEIHVLVFFILSFLWCLIGMIVVAKIEQKEHEVRGRKKSDP